MQGTHSDSKDGPGLCAPAAWARGPAAACEGSSGHWGPEGSSAEPAPWGALALPREVTVDVPEDLHEVGGHGREGHAGGFTHVDGALLGQVHVVEVDELKLGLLLRPGGTRPP